MCKDCTDTIKHKVLELHLHISGSMNIASTFVMANHNVLSGASTVTWYDAWVPIQCTSLHQSAIRDHLAFQKKLLTPYREWVECLAEELSYI